MSVRGRPRSFDREQALRSAMRVFWAKGYDATQLAELTKVMNIKPPSFYAAFRSKEAIFREAVELYLHSEGSASMRALASAATTAEAIHGMLLASVDTVLASPGANGCLLILGLVNCEPDNVALQDYLRQIRQHTIQLIQSRLEDGVGKGELPADADCKQLANFYFTVIQGISLQARDGADRASLIDTVKLAMKCN
ncbi:TetR/AcrR family transcriptional regulator [Chromobacterium subtsugae]|uniref:TetR/AcrR family transcriptional regulator n=1 Tax=Chromobacterium subtsugae TaxID=251747 RepID=A0ABS7F857_9NEIS|nr:MULTISPECIES: TetR/AcrR family transcriptional regulator [Chromobacterium]MBW7565208.1 TetR/AcrR family transcriptional regulator [Chromobacterium subtsugae]MBW8286264.1 TetR/AcrR family transcriptional regulator [Chromobacterium subtsugae]WSE91685.1 TetR/AcrR family transcriptional regulator [Chromobacterium subtsugae]WVH60060.1 TetR/AcrR family transcriptional regulator [Chromobacterium subtsugae]